MIRIASSEDGRRFRPTGEVLLRHAGCPSLVVTPDGALLALVDAYDPHADMPRTFITATRSTDGGNSWSPLQRVSIDGLGNHALNPRHAQVVFHAPKKKLLLFFTADAGPLSGGKGSMRPAMLRVAIGRDGLRYRLNPHAVGRFSRATDFTAMPFVRQKSVEVFIPIADRGNSAALFHTEYLGSIGFARPNRIRPPADDFGGCIQSFDGGLRAWAGSENGIATWVSENGMQWSAEDGRRLDEGRCPAVAKLPDGRFIMLYEMPIDETTAAQTALVSGSARDLPFAEPESDIPGEETPDGDSVEFDDLQDSETSGSAEFESESGVDTGAVEEHIAFADTITPREPGHPFAPQPGFDVHVDYFEWFQTDLIEPTDDNAYYAYATFMPDPCDLPGSKPEIPPLPNVFDEGSPFPWLPSEHPEWDEANQNAQTLLSSYEEASRHADYALPMTHAPKTMDSLPDGERLLISLELPQLTAHRALAKATLADAWRVENGKVNAQRMIRSWETVLRASAHLEKGTTLIEDLVARAQRNLAQESARWALREGVFNEQEMEQALDTHRALDRAEESGTQSIRGEHAMTMDLTQYLFSPPTPEGLPQVNPQRAQALAEKIFGKPELVEELKAMTPDDIRATLNAFDGYYGRLGQMMDTGYPNARFADLDRVYEDYKDSGPLVRELLPGLSRYHQLQARGEASRRATQLAYETHLFRARQGRWPQSLDELPGGAENRNRIDPFTGHDFGYELSEDGPRIYSRSENGQDDGGVHSPRWSDGERVETPDGSTSDDFVFWPPQPRK